jgi:hypothetical protein
MILLQRAALEGKSTPSVRGRETHRRRAESGLRLKGSSQLLVLVRSGGVGGSAFGGFLTVGLVGRKRG